MKVVMTGAAGVILELADVEGGFLEVAVRRRKTSESVDCQTTRMTSA